MIKITQEYIEKNMLGDEEWIDFLGDEKNGKVFRYENRTYLILDFLAFTGSISLLEVTNFPICVPRSVPTKEFYKWICKRVENKFKRRIKDYDDNAIKI